VRKALATLPWVEQDALKFDFDKQEIKFGLKDKKQFDAAKVKAALKAQKFPGAEVKDGPS
jgi:hypothetical protein